MQDQAKYKNFAQVIGRVVSFELKDVGENKQNLGKLTLSADGNLVNVNFWKPNWADNNPIPRIFTRIKEGQTIRVNGSLEENEYEDNIYHQISAYVGADGISSRNFQIYREDEEVEEKATILLDVDIIGMEASYDDNGSPTLECEVATFNKYNKETKEEDLSIADVVLDIIKYYVENQDDEVKEARKIAKDLSANKNKPDAIEAFKKFDREFDYNSFKVNKLHVTAHDEVAENMLNNTEAGDNVRLGCDYYNQAQTDRYGHAEGSINEVRVGKFIETNAKTTKSLSDTPLSSQDDIDDLDW